MATFETIFHSYPGKLVYTLAVLGLNAARFPLWLLYFIPSFLRQNPKWTYSQAVGVRIVQEYLAVASAIRMKTSTDIRPRGEGDRFAVIKPGSADRYRGAVDQDSEITPQTIGGTWYPARPKSGSAVGKLALHFHGGAYVIGDGRTADAGFAAKTLLANTPVTHVFAPQYRLASNPGGRFPAFLQDGISAYLYVTEELGIPAEKITISGDSAGAHLCLSLLRYIGDNPEAKLPWPACAWLWSPWVNPAAALDKAQLSIEPNIKTDYLVEGFGAWGANAITPDPSTGITLAHANLCFLGNAFATPTPLFFITGESEVLYFDDIKAYKEFRAIPGNKVGLEIIENAVHDILLVGHLVKFEEAAGAAAKRAGEFLTANE
jgi:acetyl esterase/lipase